MAMIKMALFFVAPVALTSSAQSQQCTTYVGQTVTPLTFDQAISHIPNVAPRGEYETTAQYEERRRAAGVGSGGPLIIVKTPENRDRYIRYDADAGRLAIQTYAFDNTGFDAWTALYGTPYIQALNPSTLGNFDVVISEREVATGTYQGRNGFGATWPVTRVTRTLQAIYERPRGPRDGITSGLFPSADEAPHVVGYLEMPPEVAQRTKPTMKLAFVVVPRDPYVIRSSYAGRGNITVQNPFDVTYTTTILVADVQCGLALDASNRVLGAFPTR
jgi:hypothetical protein